MAKLDSFTTSDVKTKNMGQVVDDLTREAKNKRRNFERHWYDNNFFDDGHHYRFLQRSTNKIVDLSERSTIFVPTRAIPKASRQIRGVANLLMSNEPVPVIYPEKVSVSQYPEDGNTDPNTMKPVPGSDYDNALKEAKRVAKMSGHWVEEEFRKHEMMEKLAQMLVLTAKHSVSYMQIWPDDVEEAIRTKVYDAFDIYLIGDLTSIYDSPFIIKGVPRLIAQIKADEKFDEAQLAKLNADNREASSELKEAYKRARYGGNPTSDHNSRIIQKEAFIKEYLNDDNMATIRRQNDDNTEAILKNRKEGDPVIRQVFTAGGVWLRDKYINLPDYPFVDLRLEPGPIYSVPLIQRFIPANKSLDSVISRLERYTHTMVTGTWLKKRGEQFKINNVAGGQIIEYDSTVPVQGQIAPIPQFFFNFIGLLNSFIEEQGVSTTALGKIPAGVKAARAIEGLKETEAANLRIASRQLKGTIKKVAEKFLDLADQHFVKPQTVFFLEKGEPRYFDIIGASALEGRKKLKVDTPEGVIPLKKDYRVEIEIESGLGITKSGQRANVKELIDTMLLYSKEGLIPPQAVQVVMEKWLETYQFGGTAEFMEALKEFEGKPLTDEQIEQMKLAIIEVMKDMQKAGILPTSEQRVEEGKVAAAEVLRDTGGGQQQQPQVEQKPPSKSIPFKDLPATGQVQAARQAGIDISPQEVVQHAVATQRIKDSGKDQNASSKGKESSQ